MQDKLIALFILLLSTFSLSAQQFFSNAKLKQLDKIIENRAHYIREKADRINYLKQLLRTETNTDRTYNVTYQLIEEYSNFQADSAFLYIEKNRLIADNGTDRNRVLQNRFQYVFILAQSGLLNEAEAVLISLSPAMADVSRNQKIDYYRLYQRLYMNLKEFSKNTHLEKKYNEMELAYCDSILQYTPVASEYYYLYRFKKEFNDGQYDKAKNSIKNYIQKLDTVSNDAARGYYHLSEIYRAENNYANEVHFLIKSVEADIKSAVRQNRSLRVLAEILYNNGDGDTKRAYNYLRLSLEDANFYNTRLRNTQIAEAVPIVERDYQLQRNEQEFKLKTGFVLIGVLFLIILTISLYLRKKRIELTIARKKLLESNTDLSRINSDMELKNAELNQLTEKLQESDQLKEKYLGHFLKLCSTYIQKVREFKKMVNRKIKAGQIEELHNMTLSNLQLNNDFKDFYNEFDRAFIDIFPNFIEDFNTLLKEDQRFRLKKDELLNTELRIFALIRLGIKDSSQIAQFMNYTAVTIYSYRTKVKSRAISKETFDRDILHIGR